MRMGFLPTQIIGHDLRQQNDSTGLLTVMAFNNTAVNERCYFPGTFARHKFCYWETESPEYSTPEPRRSHANTIQGLEGSNSALLATLHFRERIMSCDSKSQS